MKEERIENYECPEFEIYSMGKGHYKKVKPHPHEKELIECYRQAKNLS